MKLTKIQAQAMMNATQGALEAAQSAYAAHPTEERLNALVQAQQAHAHAGGEMAKVIHYEKHEKKTVEREDSPETAPSKEEPATSSGEDEEEEAPSTKPKMKKKAKKAEEEGDDKDAKKAAQEKSEIALPRGWATAQKAYREKAEDAYGAFGPAALYKAVAKATGQNSVAGMLGALSEIPRRLAAAEQVEARVASIEAERRTEAVNTLVEKAKVEGRTSGKDHRAQLRAIGMSHGVDHLRGIVAMLPKQRTVTDGPLQPRHDANGAPIGGPSASDQEEEKLLATMFGALPENLRAQAIADYRAQINKTLNGAAPKH
jgi:hypothetical protein